MQGAVGTKRGDLRKAPGTVDGREARAQASVLTGQRDQHVRVLEACPMGAL